MNPVLMLRVLAVALLATLVYPVLTDFGLFGFVFLLIVAIGSTELFDAMDRRDFGVADDEIWPVPADVVADVTQTHELPVVPINVSLAAVVDRDRTIEAELREKQIIEKTFDRGNV
jgi:hypothetical protein